jgi:hypothetical protein
MLVHDLWHDVAKGQPSLGGGESRPQDGGRGDSLCSGPNHASAQAADYTHLYFYAIPHFWP